MLVGCKSTVKTGHSILAHVELTFQRAEKTANVVIQLVTGDIEGNSTGSGFIGCCSRGSIKRPSGKPWAGTAEQGLRCVRKGAGG